VERTTIAGETEELGENLPSATLSHYKSHMTRSGFEPQTAAYPILSGGVSSKGNDIWNVKQTTFLNTAKVEMSGIILLYLSFLQTLDTVFMYRKKFNLL
jgi:hypothetical protein